MTHQVNPGKFDPEQYPTLQDLFGGYFHEDFSEEYGSPAEAAQAFLSDASMEEIADVQKEWSALQKNLAGKPWDDILSALHHLGSAWQPADREEWDSLHRALSGEAG